MCWSSTRIRIISPRYPERPGRHQPTGGKRRALLESLSRIPGLSVGAEAEIHSEGILGVINLSAGRSATLPAEVSDFGAQLRKTMARKVLVLPTGREIMAGNVTDTNTPFLVDLFAANGYQAKAGSVVDDDIDIAIAALSDAIGRGFGIVVSTGGTGAELKDCMVEAITALSPAAATPYVVRYQKGHGRHHKDGVRIAVGEVEQTILVALTGPHAEVRDAAPVLIDGLRRGIELNSLAETSPQSCPHGSMGWVRKASDEYLYGRDFHASVYEPLAGLVGRNHGLPSFRTRLGTYSRCGRGRPCRWLWPSVGRS